MENTLAKRWMDFLVEEGYRPVIEVNQENTSRSFIRFKAEGKKFGAYLDEDDPTFVHLDLAYTVREGRDLGLLVHLANEVSRMVKGTKATVDADGGTARFHLEWFQEGPPAACFLERSLSQLSLAAGHFFEKLEASEPAKALA